MKKTYKKNWLFNLKSALMLCAMLFAGTSMAQLSGTYTINSGGTTTGTNYANFTDFVSAINTNGVSGPVTVNVVAGSGPYTEFVALGNISGVSATNTVTINGNGETLQYAGSTSRSPVVTMDETDYFTWDNLVVSNTGTSYGRCFQLRDGSDYNTITNCDLTMPNMTGTSSANVYLYIGNGSNFSVYTYATSGQGNMISNNNMYSGGTNMGPYWGACIFAANGNSSSIPNKFHNNDIMDFRIYGIRTYYADIGTEFVGNKIHNENHNLTGYKYGIYMYQWGSGADFIIRDNYIYDLNPNSTGSFDGRYGMYFYGYNNVGTGTTEIINNVISLQGNTSMYGIYSYAYFGGTSLDIVNNTITLDNGGAASAAGTQYGIFTGYTSSNVKNNIVFSDMDKSSGNFYAFYWYDYGSGYGPPIFTNNNVNIENTTGSGSFYYGNYQGTNYSTFAALSGATGSGWNNGLAAFSDPANLDWSVVGFGLSNAGLPHTGVTTDIVNATRNSSTPDVGAFEFTVDAEIVSVDMVGGTECAPYSEAVEITVKNNGSASLPELPVSYAINGGTPVQEVVTGPIAAGASTTYTFAAIPTFNGSTSHAVVVSVDGVDDVTTNNSQTYNLTTTASPTGGDLAQGATYDGYFNTGNAADPHVTVKDYVCEFDISDPTAYPGGLGTDFTYTLNAMTMGGMTVGAGQGFSLAGSTITVDPSPSLSDSTIQVDVVVNDLNTGCDTTITTYVYVPHRPVVSFTGGNICLGDVATFTNTSTLSGADYMLQTWEFDDPDPLETGDNSTIKDGFWNYTQFGTANVKLTVVNGVYPLFQYTDSMMITITPKPEVDFKVLNACEGVAIQFNNLTSLPVPGTLTYNWMFGDGNTSTATSPAHTYATPGQRQVTLVATANGCDATLTKNAYQFEQPTAGFTSVGACNNEDIQFTNTSSIANGANMGYTWDFNSGAGVSTLTDPTYNSPAFGSIPVELTVISEFGCTDVISQNVVLLESPVADFTWNNGGPACNLTPVQFTNTGTAPNGGAGTSYSWAEGAQFSTQENPSYALTSIGMHTITFTAADLNGCSSSITKDVPVVLQAVADFVAMDVCEGEEAVFTNTSTVAAGNLDYQWSMNPGTSTDHTGKTIYPVTNTTRVVNVTLDAIVPGGCSDQITKSINVFDTPDASFTTVREGRFAYVTANANSADVSIYQWNSMSGTAAGSETAGTETYEFENIDYGTYDICLAIKNANCWSDNCDQVTINLASVADLTENNNMIAVYPNPTAGTFNLDIEDASDDVVIMVTDILGNTLPMELTDNLNGNYVVNLSGIANGVYFVQVKNGDFYATKKITVSK